MSNEDIVLHKVIQEMSGMKYCYRDIVRGGVDMWIEHSDLVPKDSITEDGRERIVDRVIEILNHPYKVSVYE